MQKAQLSLEQLYEEENLYFFPKWQNATLKHSLN